MRHRKAWFLLPALLVAVTACQPKTVTRPSARNGPPSGCRVERLEAAEQAIRQLFERAEAYVYSMDGDLASCKFEVFYKADEASEEKTLFTESSDSAVEILRSTAEADGKPFVPDNRHHVLSIVVPEFPPKAEDMYIFSCSIQSLSKDDGKQNRGVAYRRSKEARKILPNSILGQGGFSGHSGSPSTKSRTLKPGEEFTLLDMTFHRSEAPLGGKHTDFLRHRLTVRCLGDVNGVPLSADDVSARKELTKWEGNWETDHGATLTIKGDRWTSHAPGSAVVVGKMNVIEIRPTLTLADLLVEEGETKGQTCKMILRLEGDTLHYCGTYSQARPTEFKSTYENQNVCYAWKRTRKASAK